MTRLMSFCTRPTVAAKNAVAAPTMATTILASGAYSNIGDRRHTMNTPAVTMVAAWISADTGVGPSIASGSQVWRPSCADLPIAPMNSRMQSVVTMSTSQLRKWNVCPTLPGVAAKTASKLTVPKIRNTPMMPRAKPKSPMRLTMKALIAAALALGRWNQKPISR